MKFVALVSGGKDSNYNILHCLKNGHELVAFANLHPYDENEQELDSFMFQTVGHDLVSWYEKCTGIPLYKQSIRKEGSKNVDLNYSKTKGDEIEDMFTLLQNIKNLIPDLEAVSVGAILSSYQRTRVEDTCSRLGLTVLSYLWQRNQLELMQEMCSMSKDVTAVVEDESNSGLLDARIIKVAAIGLYQSHLGLSLPQIFPTMLKLNSLYQVHICGEGGEFETMVLDAPYFKHGFLKIISINDVSTEENDGVYSARFDVEFVPRNLPDNHLSEQLERLPVPSLLDSLWLELQSDLSANSFVVDDTSNNKTEPIQISTPVSINDTGRLLYISNIKPGIIGGIQEECEDVFNQLGSILEARSIFASQIMASSLILSDMSTFSEVNRCYNEFFNASCVGPLPPSRACVGSSLIGCSLQLSVIVDLTARCEPLEDGLIVNKSKDGLHVQGRSYWCPCNIGPYSQSIWNRFDRNRIANVSGQIALDPPSMNVFQGTGVPQEEIIQSVVSLRHYWKLTDTIECRDHISMVCYVSTSFMVPIVSKTWELYNDQILPDDKAAPCLVIARVSELPRGALCEWGGINCREKVIQDDYDEDDLAAQIHKNLTLKNQLDFSFPDDTEHVEVSENDVKRHFVTLFLDSFDDLTTSLSEYNSTQITLYFSPDHTVPEYTNVEYFPVQEVYDYNGRSRKYALLIKY